MEPLRKRVKVYQLDNSGKWDDKGTGHVSCIYVDALCAMGLIVRSESDNSVILQTRLSAEDIYQKQQDSLIVWTEPDSQLDLALSFQDSLGCQDIWENILQYQNQRTGSCDSVDLDLPPVSINNLQAINELLEASLPMLDKDKVINSIFKEDLVKSLLDLFDEVEKSGEGGVHLFQIFNIFKNLILFNDTSILEVILSEDYLVRVMGALEYDPEISENNRIKHREFLNQQVVFKQVIKFPSKSLIGTIHQTFRIQYLKDVVLPRVLDDVTFSSLNSLIYFNNIDIVSQIQNDSDFLENLFSQIQKSEKNSEERKDLISFLQDLCNLAKGLQIQSKSTFFTVVVSLGLFKTLSSILDDENVQTRVSCTEIVLSTLLHDPDILRSYLCSPTSGNSKFLVQLINLFITDKDIGVKNQIVEIIKTLLEADSYDSSDFFRLFYDKGIDLLVSPLNEVYKGEPTIPGDPSSNLDSFVLYNIMELVIYCIKHHCYRIKHFIVEEGIAKKILRYTNPTGGGGSAVGNSERYLILGSIRFFRSMVNMKDDLYNQHIIQENLFEPIIEVFKSNISRYNLLNSAIIELFQYIYKEEIRDLIVFLVERYRELFESVTYTDVLKQLILKYEQIKDSSFESPETSCNNNDSSNDIDKPIIGNNKINHNYQRTQREIDEEEEEAYFNRDDDSDDEDDEDELIPISFNNNKQICTNNENIEKNNENNGNNGNGSSHIKFVDYEEDEDDDEINRSTEADDIQKEEKKDKIMKKNSNNDNGDIDNKNHLDNCNNRNDNSENNDDEDSKSNNKNNSNKNDSMNDDDYDDNDNDDDDDDDDNDNDDEKMEKEEKQKEEIKENLKNEEIDEKIKEKQPIEEDIKKDNQLQPDETVFNGKSNSNNNNSNKQEIEDNRKTIPKRKLEYDRNESVVSKKIDKSNGPTAKDNDTNGCDELSNKKLNINNNNNNNNNNQNDENELSSASEGEEEQIENGKHIKKFKRGKKDSNNSSSNNSNNSSPTPSELHV
ncbi:hypothetical protein RB653_008712 [Dictyostelium firmibasis]|uniref:Serine/threonine-protein phosphatase 4 regulatory subunit 3-like central domain-containing protein n=1 Tax=Dictyostelium firmibasis TaxID=79012 RepID=A0AAN7YPI4_9MYCE